MQGQTQLNALGKLMANNQDKTKVEVSAHPEMEQSLLTLVQSAFYNPVCKFQTPG